MLKRTGKTVEYGEAVFEFDTEEDAINFEKCINRGGSSASCAEQCRCVRKSARTRDKSRGLGR